MDIIILAGGLGTRFKELSVFPKVLLQHTDGQSILSHNLNVLKEAYGDLNVTLVINDKYYDMVHNYVTINKLGVNVVKSSNTNGSYNTLRSVRSKLPNGACLIIWSDLIISSAPDLSAIRDEKNVIFTSPGSYRYEAKGSNLYKKDKGNVPGLYYTTDMKDLMSLDLDCKDNYDLVDRINEIGGFTSTPWGSQILEYRDLCVYLKEYRECKKDKPKYLTRFFNEIVETEDGKLKKRVTDVKYKHLIEKELEWYKTVGQKKYVPTVYESNDESFVMDKLDAKPLNKALSALTKKDIENGVHKEIYNKLKSILDDLHSVGTPVTKAIFLTDLYKELVGKVLTRCEDIKHMLINYDKKELEPILTKAYDVLSAKAPFFYSLCHGDLNGSNVLINKDNDLFLIDPRGYFGDTKMFGWDEYEKAKLLYCLYGYDEFNDGFKVYGYDEPKKFDWADQIDWLCTPTSKMIVAIIYIALAGYISQDIQKANIAYDFGLKMLKECIKN